MNSTAISLIFGLIYFLLLVFSIKEKRLSRNLWKPVLIGFLLALIISCTIVSIIVEVTSYNFPETYLSSLVYVPIVEESSKLLAVILGFYLLKKFFEANNQMILRMGGGVGLGFAIFETFANIISNTNFAGIFERLLVSVPSHISMAMLLAFGLTQKSKMNGIVFIVSGFAFHSLSNLLSFHNHLLQGIIFWVILIFLFLTEKFDLD